MAGVAGVVVRVQVVFHSGVEIVAHVHVVVHLDAMFAEAQARGHEQGIGQGRQHGQQENQVLPVEKGHGFPRFLMNRSLPFSIVGRGSERNKRCFDAAE